MTLQVLRIMIDRGILVDAFTLTHIVNLMSADGLDNSSKDMLQKSLGISLVSEPS